MEGHQLWKVQETWGKTELYGFGTRAVEGQPLLSLYQVLFKRYLTYVELSSHAANSESALAW